jgi:hypothetical protein
MSMHGGKAPRILSFPVADAQTILLGSVLVASSGKAAVGTAAAANAVIGIAMEPKASVATAAVSDRVTVALATPGTVFIGSGVLSATDDYATPTFGDVQGDATGRDFVRVTYGGASNQFACIDMDATSTVGAAVLGFAVEQLKGQNFVVGSGGTINPRIYFTFSTLGLFAG